MKNCLSAYTAAGSYPPYLNVSRDGDDIVVTVRAAPTERKGIHVCSHEPGPGRCTPGGPTCNNYCNMAPDKGPMADQALPCDHIDVGATTEMRLPVDAFRTLLGEIQAGLE